MSQRQAVPPPKEESTTPQFQATPVSQASDIIDKLDATLGPIYWTCANRFQRFVTYTKARDWEGKCNCSRSRKVCGYPIYRNPIRCDENGEPLPGAVPQKGEDGE